MIQRRLGCCIYTSDDKQEESGRGDWRDIKKYSYNKGAQKENLKTPCCHESLAKPMRFKLIIFLGTFSHLTLGLGSKDRRTFSAIADF